jgi:hypothetical protein
MMSLGAIAFDGGDFQSALPLYVEACRVARAGGSRDIFTFTEAQRQIAVLSSLQGDHQSAIARLDCLYRIASASGDQYLRYACLNSLAVELGEAGRLEEAAGASSLVLASPFAPAYPEWRATFDEIKLKSYRSPRSFVPLQPAPVGEAKVVPLPLQGKPDSIPGERAQRARVGRPGTVTKIDEWKSQMSKLPNPGQNGGGSRQEISEMTEEDMLARIIELSCKKGIPGGKLRRILDAVVEITSETEAGD